MGYVFLGLGLVCLGRVGYGWARERFRAQLAVHTLRALTTPTTTAGAAPAYLTLDCTASGTTTTTHRALPQRFL